MRVKVEVTQEDIEDGRRHACDECPVALALTRALDNQFGGIHVHEDVIAVTTIPYSTLEAWAEDGYAAGTIGFPPKKVANFIRRFDMGLSVEPFTFTLNLVKGKPGLIAA